MEIYKQRILTSNAFNKLKIAYESDNSPMHFDVLAQAHLHCEIICGLEVRYLELVCELERLEENLEIAEGRYFLPRWRAKHIYMDELLKSGKIHGSDNIEKAAAFMEKIGQVLKSDNDMTNLQSDKSAAMQLDELLHPVVVESAWPQYQNGQLRDAVLNAFIAIGDLIRARTSIELDGKPLAERALSIREPLLILSTLETESGRNDQLGFMQIIAGCFQGIRNPKAHTLQHDLNHTKAAQYLVLASLLARRICDATQTN